MSFTPTQEQLDILEAFNESRVLKVNAVAGSGKSTTLRYLSENYNKPSLYVCFNKTVATEAATKFPSHVECRTMHSLAYSRYGKILLHKLSRPVGKYKNVAGTPSEIVLYYKVSDLMGSTYTIPAIVIATFAKQVVNRYQNSAEEQVNKVLLPIQEFKLLNKEHPDLDKKELGLAVLKLAKKLWLDRVDPSSDVLCEHDTYLKLWQLSKPVLNYDVIYLDEAQDSNPTTLDIIGRQSQAKVVYVGDTYQSIYQWRGAVNAMETITAPTKVLSKSFRYGQEIADVATWVIDEAIMVNGLETIDSKVQKVLSDKFTMIFRTNAALLENAVNLIRQGQDVFCEADIRGFIKKLESADALYKMDMKQVKHEDITMFATWNDLLQGTEDDPELKRISKIVESNQTYIFIKALSAVEKKASKANIILTTAHKSKGKEWDSVILGDDFPTKAIVDSSSQAEINLFYVACTRAIKELQLPKSFDAFFVKEEYLID